MQRKAMSQTFGKEYKLCNKTIIDEIFDSGAMIKSYPLLIKYKLVVLKNDTPFQIVISAPKRTFKNAFRRNRIKRICTEAIRKNKQPLECFLKEHNKQLGLFLIYSAYEELSDQLLEQKTEKLFNKLIANLNDTIQS